MEDDGVETDTVEEGDGGGEGVEFIGEDGAPDLDDGKFLRLDGGEVAEVLFNFLARSNVVEQLCDRLLLLFTINLIIGRR